MKIQRRLTHGGLLLLAVLLTVGIAWAAPQLSVSPLGYRLVQVTQVPNQPRPTIDIVARAGIVNRGDPALKVSATLTGSGAGITVLDGLVSFGDVPRTKVWSVTSRDTFALRVILPAKVNPNKPAQVYLFALSLLPRLTWSISCDTCGGNQAPVANAGADQTVYVGSLVTLDGSASTDADGNALTYKWAFASRPTASTAALSSTTAVRPTFTIDMPGSYVLQLIVNDGKQDSAADTVTITTQNSTPVANAGADQTVDLGDLVQLNGTLSIDVDGNTLTYAWNLLSQPSGSSATLANPATATPQFTPDVAGQYVVELVVDDGTASSLPDTVVITTRPANAAPIANAGPDQTVPVGSTAQLDGSASSDPDAGDVLSFAWSLLSRPTDSSATLFAAGSSQPSFPVDKTGDYVIQLTVSDGKVSNTDTVLVSTQNGPPTANAGVDQTVHAGAVVQLDGSQSADPDNDPLGFTWSLLNQPAGSVAQLSDPFAINPIFTADKPGLYTSQLIVNDGRSDSAPATVNTTATNTDPVAADDIATTPRDTPVVINVLGNDTDADNDALVVASVTMPANGTAVIEGTQVRYTPNAGFVGDDTFNYTIDDGLGGTASATVTITVTFVDDSVPTAVLRVTPNPAEVGATVTLTGVDSTDLAPGTVVRYTFTLVSAPAGYVTSNGLAIGTPVSQDTPSRTFVPNVTGSYTLQLIVRDSGGNDSAPAAAALTAVSSDLAVAKTVNNATPTVGSNVTFAVTVSNAGPSIATGVSVADSLPNGYAFVSANSTQGSYSNTTGAWTVGAVNSGADATLTITATVLAAGNYTNIASLSASTPTDRNSANDSAAVVVTPVPIVDPDVTVPNVTGLTQDAAAASLTAADLKVGTVTEESSETVPAGKVARQEPPAGASAPRGSSVDLVLSSGPATPGLPPDPSTVATPLNTAGSTPFGSSAAFLYSGGNPIQTGVGEGVIDPTRIAIIRGRVLDVNGRPLPAARVTINNHPQFGQTLSRADGRFDIAVNGGQRWVVNLSRDGYLPVQRGLATPLRDFVVLPDVVMIRLDEKATTVTPASATDVVVHRATPVQDDDGTRAATLMFRPGTGVTLTLPDGSSRAIGTLTVRATEYTVGAFGPKAMPGDLPNQTAYTYAVEFSVDEAIAVGATSVRFDKPVVSYAENFLDFPIGTPVPLAYYDRLLACWVPVKDGRVLKILGVSSGLAQIDADGDGDADSDSELSALGMDADERRVLASDYSAGTTLWRFAVDHFSSYDANFSGGGGGNPPGGKGPRRIDGDKPKNPKKKCGSIVECETQALREAIPVANIPWALTYASDLAPGYEGGRSVVIQLSEESVPADLISIRLTIDVAGQEFEQEFPPLPNQTYEFTWDGRDAWGRELQQSARAAITLIYAYDGQYQQPVAGGASFGVASGIPIEGVETREPVLGARFSTINLAPPSRAAFRVAGLGGWLLEPVHYFDYQEGELILGTGQQLRANALGAGLVAVLGTGNVGISPDGTLASEATLGTRILDFEVAPDGKLYFIERRGDNGVVRRVDAQGRLQTIAGSSTCSFSGDGGPAISAGLCDARDLAIAPDGSVFIADVGNNRVRRIDPSGRISTFAGNGEGWEAGESSGDGGPATSARIPGLGEIAVDGSCCLFFADDDSIRRVGPNGVVSTIVRGALPDGDYAGTLFELNTSISGDLYFANYSNGYGIYKLGADGVVQRVIGGPNFSDGPAGDNGPAAAAQIGDVEGLAVDSRGRVYFVDDEAYDAEDSEADVVRMVDETGVITRYAGVGLCDAAAPLAGAGTTNLGLLDGLAVDQNDRLLILQAITPEDGCADYNNTPRVLRVESPYPILDQGEALVASEDGRNAYVFNEAGRHLRTLSTDTGAVLYTIAYTADGQLSSVTDIDGNVTQIVRDASGKPLLLRSPYGIETTLNVGAGGYIETVVGPDGARHAMTYTASGLLNELTNPRGFKSGASYDDRGRLVSHPLAIGGYALSRTETTDDAYEVTLSTGQGRSTSYRLDTLPDGTQVSTVTNPDGTAISSTQIPGVGESSRAPDGTLTETGVIPDVRFGLQAPVLSNASVRVPSGLKLNISQSEKVSLSDPNNPLSLIGREQTLTINGSPFLTSYSRASREAVVRSAEGRTVVYATDSAGRVTEQSVPGIHATSLQYDSGGRVVTVNQGGRNSQITYDSKSYLSSMTDPLGRTATFVNDPFGRVTALTRPDGRQVTFGYDTNGNIIELTPPGRPAHTFEYTAADLVAVYRAPDVGDGLNLTTVAYSSDRQVELVTLPGGDSVDPEYDQSGRLASVTIGRGQYVLSYDASTGQLKSITAPDGGSVSTSYEGFLVTGQTWAGEIQGSVSQTYDNDFRVVTQSVNGSDTVSFGYDRDGLLLRAGDMFLSREAGNGVLLGSLLGTLSDEYTYDDFGEVTGYSARADGGSLYSIQYSRDSIGRIIEKRETENGTTRAWAYTHDIGGRLVEVRRDGQPTSTYSYDANGNRLSRIKPGASEVGTYDVQDRMLSYGNSNFTYSPDGRLQGKVEGSEVTTYSYDELGNLILVGTPDGSTIEYIIDGQNRRVGRKVNGVVTHRWLYEGALRPIAELDAAGNLVSRFVYGAKINVPDFLIRGGTVYRIVSDLRGSPRVVVNHGTGEVVQRIDYDEFGIVIEDTNPGFQPFGFAGGLWDPKTGLTRFGARDYDARTGRWTTKDPAGFLGGTNLYAYASNDPESRTDPTGLYVPEDALTSRRSAPVGGRSTPGLVSTIGAQGNCQYFFFGGSVGRGQVTGGGSACTYTQVCLRIGFGAYLGVGAVGGIGYGPPPSEGGEISVGIGADAGGGGLDFGGQVQIGSGGGVSGSGAGPGAGAGAGGSVGIDLCYQDVSSCRPDK